MNFEIYFIEALPLFLMGVLCGFIRFARTENELANEPQDENKKAIINRTRYLRGIDVVLTSAITGLIVFALLSYFSQISYIIRVAIAAAVALYGIDRILEFIHKIISLKKEAKQ